MIRNENKFNDHKVKLTNAMYDMNDTNTDLSDLSNRIKEIEKKREYLIKKLDEWQKKEKEIEEEEKKDLFEVSEEAKKLYTFFGIIEDDLPNIDYIQPTFRIINNITKYLTEEVSDGGYSNGPINIPIAWMPESITENFTKGISIAYKKHLIPPSINIGSVYSLSPITPPTAFSNDSTSTNNEQSSTDANKYDPSEYITRNQDIKSDVTIISEISEISKIINPKEGDDETVALYEGIKKQSYENAMNRSAGIPRAYENGPAYFLKRCSKSLFNNMDDFENKSYSQNTAQFQTKQGEKAKVSVPEVSGKFWQIIDNIIIDNIKTEADIQKVAEYMKNVESYNKSNELSPKDFVKTYRDNSTELRNFRVNQIKYMLEEAISRIKDTREKLSIDNNLQKTYESYIERDMIYEVTEDVKIFTDTSFYESGNDQKNSNDYCVTQEKDSDVMKIIDEFGFNNKVEENKIKETLESEEFQNKLNQKIIDNKDDQLKFILDLHKGFKEILIEILFRESETINRSYYDQVNKRLQLAANLRRIDKIINYIPLIRIEQGEKKNIIPDSDYYTSLIRHSLNYEEYINIIDDDGNEITIEVIDHDTKLNNFRNKFNVLKKQNNQNNQKANFIINLNIPKIKKDNESLANDIKIFKKIYHLSEADINNDQKIKPMINTLKKKYRNNAKLENISRQICKKINETNDVTNKKIIDSYLVSLILHPDHFDFLKYFHLNDLKKNEETKQQKYLRYTAVDINKLKDYQVSFAEKILKKFTIKGHEIKFDISDCDKDLILQFYYNYILELIYELNDELNDELKDKISIDSLKNNLLRFFLYNYLITQHILTQNTTSKNGSSDDKYLNYEKIDKTKKYMKKPKTLEITREEGISENNVNFWKNILLPGIVKEYRKYATNIGTRLYENIQGDKKKIKDIFTIVIKKIYEFLPKSGNDTRKDEFVDFRLELAQVGLTKDNFSVVSGYIYSSFREIQDIIKMKLSISPNSDIIKDALVKDEGTTTPTTLKSTAFDLQKNKTYIDLKKSELKSQRSRK
jgi:hypothetical protein